jgi:HEAT repeat protein
VAQALGNVADLHALEPLINALEDKDQEVRHVAASALGELRNQRAVDPLIMALKDRSHYVRASAAKALKKITRKDFGQDMEKWQQWWHRQQEP